MLISSNSMHLYRKLKGNGHCDHFVRRRQTTWGLFLENHFQRFVEQRQTHKTLEAVYLFI